MKIIRKYTSQICTTIFIIMILVFMIFMTRVNIRHDKTPAIDDNARLETLTGIVSSDYANVSQRFFQSNVVNMIIILLVEKHWMRSTRSMI